MIVFFSLCCFYVQVYISIAPWREKSSDLFDFATIIHVHTYKHTFSVNNTLFCTLSVPECELRNPNENQPKKYQKQTKDHVKACLASAGFSILSLSLSFVLPFALSMNTRYRNQIMHSIRAKMYFSYFSRFFSRFSFLDFHFYYFSK